MLSLIAMIPGVGPGLAAFLGVVKSGAQSAAGVIGPILKNPYVLGALVASAFFLLYQREETDKAAIRAKDARLIAGYQTDLDIVLGANKTLLQSLNWQTGQVKALHDAEARKTVAAEQAASRAREAVDAAAKVARHVEAYAPPQGSSDASAALAILKGKAD